MYLSFTGQGAWLEGRSPQFEFPCAANLGTLYFSELLFPQL